jgi:methionyl-tRNA formyltransferase
MTKIVFMGTPEFAVPSLKRLIASHQVVGVVTQPDRPAGRGRQLQPPPVKLAAQANDIPVYQPISLRSEEAIEPIRKWAPDLITVAAFGQILRAHLLNLPPKGCLNIHASLLPRWRGAAPIQYAILSGDEESGVSLMRMDEGLDTGPVYVRQAIPIQPDETAATLHDRLAGLGASMLDDYLDRILDGELAAEAQDDTLSTYAPMLKKDAGVINWTQSAGQVDRQIRAMTPWPSAFTSWQGIRLKVLAAEPLASGDLPAGEPGRIVLVAGSAAVRTADGGIMLKRLQLAGKRAATVEEFLRGHSEFIGSRLSGS